MIDNGKIWGQIADLFDNYLMDAGSVETVRTLTEDFVLTLDPHTLAKH